MTTLLTFRDNIKAFCGRYDYILSPVLKFILTMTILVSINGRMGYMAQFNNRFMVLMLSCICAFLPVEFIAGIGGLIIIFHSVQVSLDAALVGLALILIFYCGYMRFIPKTGIIVLLMPLLYVSHLLYAAPIILGFMVGPAAIIPAIFGIILYYYENSLGELMNLLAAVTEEDEGVSGYQYILSTLVENKLMLLTIIVFSCVILVTYIVYRIPFTQSWIVAFLAGGFLNVVLFLIGSVTLSVEVKIGSILLGSIVGIAMAVVFQFCKGIVDYQRTEILQFEDDEYYYYVKAIPKLSVTETNKNVKHINPKAHN